MDKIIVLDEVLASKIAAGEVVERPASIVKELVENSIDAGAARISIEILGGGKSLIRVTDNGCGMSPRDAQLSFERHATSKIKNIEDLFNIYTLGFRGEALSSISAVSRLTMLTNDGEYGTQILVEGGNTADKKEASCPKGTSITVEDLFFNTPARLKYLKSDSTETSHISGLVSKFILSHPNISIKLTSNGKQILNSDGNGSLEDAIASVYGASFLKNLIGVQSPHIKGFISKPQETKINKDYQIFFVNGRCIKNFLLSKAVENAYYNLIPKDRHPAAIFFLTIDPKEIDVNVHPAKKEIKFEKTKIVLDSLTDAVTEALIDASAAQLISEPAYMKDSVRAIHESPQHWEDQRSRIWAENISQQPFEIQSNSVKNSSSTETIDINPPLPLGRGVRGEGLGVRVLAQLNQTYIICIDGSDLVLIDQHAAHERILYEKLKADKIAQKNAQYLLIPEIIELPPKEFLLIEENINIIKELGFDMDVFGNNSLRIKAIPSEVTKINLKQLLSDISFEIQEGLHNKIEEAMPAGRQAKERITKLIACHGAIKAGDPLNREEINNLVEQLYETTNPSTCPHGRPSIVKIESSKIPGFFNRQK